MNASMTRFLQTPALSTIPIPKQEPDDLLLKAAYIFLILQTVGILTRTDDQVHFLST